MNLNPFTKVVGKLTRLVCTKIEVHISEPHFTFISKKGTFKLKTFIYVEKINGKFEIAAVGEDPIHANRLKKIDLFSKDSHLDKYECLKRFIQHGLSLTSRKHALVRPEVRCVGWQNLTEYFSGYEQGILINLFNEAGALNIVFK